MGTSISDDDDVYYYIRWRLKLEGETENMGVCTKEWKGDTAEVLMATPCTNSLGGESGGQKQHEGCGGCKHKSLDGKVYHYPFDPGKNGSNWTHRFWRTSYKNISKRG